VTCKIRDNIRGITYRRA